MERSDFPLDLVVDGQEFTVTAGEREGQHHLDWTSGPNAGYGFTCQTSDRSWLDREQLSAQARDFLANVDPVTGYLE